jgi:hypothetical protein
MAVTVVRTSTAVSASTQTSTVFTTASTLGATPTTGNLVVLCIARNNEGAITAPSGWTEVGVANSASATAQTAIYFRVITGSEASSYTWTHASSTRAFQAFEFASSLPNAVWELGQFDVSTDTTPSSTTVNVGTLPGANATAEVAGAFAMYYNSGAEVQSVTGGGTWAFYEGGADNRWFGALIGNTASAFTTTATDPNNSRARTSAVLATFIAVPPPVSPTGFGGAPGLDVRSNTTPVGVGAVVG